MRTPCRTSPRCYRILLYLGVFPSSPRQHLFLNIRQVLYFQLTKIYNSLPLLIITKEVQQFFTKKLNLPATGNEQDWDMEMSDPNRIREFITFYYAHNLLPEQYLLPLISLILNSAEEYLHKNSL